MPRIRPETVLLKARMRALAQCRFPPASWSKRFVRDVCGGKCIVANLSEKQKAVIERLAWTFRRQLPAEIRPSVKPEGVR